MSQRSTTIRSQAGFTLVELAIVMIIIGLLIGGVLKGQELIGNAQVTATVAQVKAIEAATSTFKDTYAGLPGDILTPNNRLPNCTVAPCSTAGDGNGRLNNNPSVTPVAAEGERYFVHLNAANLLTGIVPTAVATTNFGGNFPATKVSGAGFQAGSSTGAVAEFPGVIGADVLGSGLYLTVANAVGVPSAGNGGLRPNEAFRIDTKVDDGVPDTGSIRGYGTAAACGTTAAGGGTYVTSVSTSTCGLYIRIQG
jgi:prepilin-type N-terminal cleavage/methylation domain-containing protein